MRQFKIACSPYGLFAFVLQELPYLPWLLWPPANNPLANNDPAGPLWGILEQGGGILTIALLILIVRKDALRPSAKNPYCIAAISLLAIYYASWIGYYAGMTSGWNIVFGLSATVPLYYLCCALWLKNPFAVITSVLFLIGHTGSNAINFLGWFFGTHGVRSGQKAKGMHRKKRRTCPSRHSLHGRKAFFRKLPREANMFARGSFVVIFQDHR